MRAIHTLPLAAAILLAACGGSGETDADGDEKISGDELTAAAADMVQPRPGQYRTTAELVEFEVPGMPDEQKQMMRTMMSQGAAQAATTCLTPEDVEKNGARGMVQNMAEGDCEFSKFNVNGGTIDAEMQCKGAGGPAGTVKMTGTMEAEKSSMTMEFDQSLGEQQAHIKMRMNSERIGDCPA